MITFKKISHRTHINNLKSQYWQNTLLKKYSLNELLKEDNFCWFCKKLTINKYLKPHIIYIDNVEAGIVGFCNETCRNMSIIRGTIE